MNKMNELFETIKKELYTPVVGDILDGMGFYHQFLPAGIAPIHEEDKVVGYAMPVLMIDVYGPQKKPFGLLTEALDQLREGDVYLASGGDNRCAYWGELLTATAKKRGAAGAVINGYYRDSHQVMGQDFPVFSKGRFAQDSGVRTQVADYRCEIEVGGVAVRPGDLVFGDVDGVLVIPKEHAEEVIEKSLEKARGEKVVRKAIENGMSATEAFATYGIL
ncbi:MAG: RraA family protein [Lachnospiraceae bacterium]|nr:RraA family protein [Lachnospiraceae bacterium]